MAFVEDRSLDGKAILGISLGFDSGAVIIRDGIVLAAINEERLSRVKNHKIFPTLAIYECLKISGLAPSDISEVALANYEADTLYQLVHRYTQNCFIPDAELMDKFNELHAHPYIRQSLNLMAQQDQMLKVALAGEAFRGIIAILAGMDINVDKIQRLEHHWTHAIPAYYFSGFDPLSKTLIITSDGFGDGLSSTISMVENGSTMRMASSSTVGSIALLYQFVTGGLGFKMHQHEGKVTGLAAYGNPDTVLPEFEKICILNEFTNEFNWSMDVIDELKLPTVEQIANPIENLYFFESMRDYIFNLVKNGGYSREDIAAGIQRFSEKMITSWITNFMCMHLSMKDKVNVCLSGGLFANVKINQRIHELPYVDQIFVFPAMGDTGGAMGAALGHYFSGRKLIPVHLDNVFFGSDIDEPINLGKEIVRMGVSSDSVYVTDDKISQVVANLLAQGNLVARVTGKMEYGPRALTHRSILFNCNDRSVNTWLNKQLGRDEIMPYAPVMKMENAHKCFDKMEGAEYTSKFMTVTKDATDFFVKNCPAAVHIDNTARPQLIIKEENEEFWDILDAYEKITGNIALINTSYNVHNEPIVRTAEEAITVFLKSNIQYLMLGNFLIKRSDVCFPPMSLQ